MPSAGTVIIGGGVVGASIAYHLAERGCRDVVVLERESALGHGSTGKATGGVRAQFGTDINILLSLYSIDFFKNWNVASGYDPRGYLLLATSEAEMDFLTASSARQRELGYSDVGLLEPAEIAGLVPGLNCDGVIGASLGPRDGFIDPIAVLDGFASRAAAAGVRFVTGVTVTGIDTSGERVTGVRTVDEVIECRQAVVCAGAWAADVAATAGVDLPVEPARRQIVWARTKEPLSPEMPLVVDLGTGFLFRSARDSDREVLMTCPDETGPGFDSEFCDEFIDRVYGHVAHRAPFLAATSVVREKCRAGLYENSPDHHAILGTCNVEGLYLANGFSGHGVMHSPATGRALAEIMLDGEASFLDVSSLHVDRFAKGELLHEAAFL